MSVYIVEEENETPVYINSTTHEEIIEYWRLYSPLQKKRFNKVLIQLKSTWFDVYNQIKFLRDNNAIDLNDSNFFMNKIHKMFIIQLKNKIEYYNEEKLRLRKNKNYLSKKINKLKTNKKAI
jgi:hypothetical protein